jgi:hypothetical protein
MPTKRPNRPNRLNPLPTATAKLFPISLLSPDFSEAQINHALALDTTLTVYQLTLLHSAEQHPRQCLPLWGEPHLNHRLRAVANPVYDMPALLTAAELQEVVQLKALETLGLLRLLERTDRDCWQLTVSGQQVCILNRWRHQRWDTAPPMNPNAA